MKCLNDIGYAQSKDPELVDICNNLKAGKPNKHYILLDKRLYHVGQPILKDNESRLQLAVPKQMIGLVLQAYHQPYHLGIDRTYALMHQRVHWKTMYRDVVLHCTRCLQCQRANLKKQQAPLRSRALPAYPMQAVAIDTVGPLPESEEGYRYIVSLICMFSGFVEAWPTKDKSSLTVSKLLLKEFIPRHSVPMTLLSDCGGEFMADIIDLLAANLGIHKVSITPYSPWSNGQVERFNGTLKKGLLKRVNDGQRDWPDHLPAVLMAHRVSVQESSRYSSFFLLYGRDPVLPMDTLLRPKMKYAGECWTTIQLGRMHEAFALVKKNTEAERARQKRLYDRNSKQVKLEVGMAVWYYYPVVQEGMPAKLQQKWLPHYRIVMFKSPVAAVIRHQPTGETRTVHVNHLQPAILEDAWDKVYESAEPVANRRIQNTKRAAYEKEQEKRQKQATATRQQPMRGCRLMVPPAAIDPPHKNDVAGDKASEPKRPRTTVQQKRPLQLELHDAEAGKRQKIGSAYAAVPIKQDDDCVAHRTRSHQLKRQHSPDEEDESKKVKIEDVKEDSDVEMHSSDSDDGMETADEDMEMEED